ncbi:WhiB family transcriptional regulator [Dietzia kunjamensis]|uniref:WhiB family transcriptional regulator n=1 Tax=Dietzia kunjamensis TaxID=322509 RepID=UPI002DB85C4C|nr:WhiB family transcriptional regulator [Dietzia kunjamensis]MEB8327648.1 WhiB family transcriptional regulator [Dietzia kunjamensis]
MFRPHVTGVDDRWAWADRGSCQGQPELFYNDDEDSKGLRRRKEQLAKDICERCPVLAACRGHAISARELYGVWGGLSEMERHTLAGRLRTG